jgi:hypothetical protein
VIIILPNDAASEYFSSTKKWWDVTGSPNVLTKNALNFFVLFLPVLIFNKTIIICNYNFCIIITSNDDATLQDPICCSKFPWAREIISPKTIDNFGTGSDKGSPAMI